MTQHPFLKGMGLGVLAGAAVSAVMVPKKKQIERTAKKAMRTVGGLAEDLTDSMGF